MQVKEKSSVSKVAIDEIAEFIQDSYPNHESGIVYCFSRKECEQVCLIMDLNVKYILQESIMQKGVSISFMQRYG